jgi:hypothetical protein
VLTHSRGRGCQGSTPCHGSLLARARGGEAGTGTARRPDPRVWTDRRSGGPTGGEARSGTGHPRVDRAGPDRTRWEPDREAPATRTPSPAFEPLGDSSEARAASGEGEQEPHGRERSKHTAGPGEAQAVKVVRNGEGGPQRAWNPATRRATSGAVLRDRVGKRVPGSGFSGLGASEGQRTSGEDVRWEGKAVRRRPGEPDRNAEEVLEGERKAMSGRLHQLGNQLAGGRAEDTRVHTARCKGRRWSREATRATTLGRHVPHPPALRRRGRRPRPAEGQRNAAEGPTAPRTGRDHGSPRWSGGEHLGASTSGSPGGHLGAHQGTPRWTVRGARRRFGRETPRWLEQEARRCSDARRLGASKTSIVVFGRGALRRTDEEHLGDPTPSTSVVRRRALRCFDDGRLGDRWRALRCPAQVIGHR